MNTRDYSLLGKMKFLIVDDHDFMRSIISEALISRGVAEIQRASDGAEALNMLNKMGNKIDFIIADFNMPKMNGLELLKAVRVGAIRVNRDIPVIMLSGFDDESLLMCAMKLDANGFIAKPVSRDDLLVRMERIIMNEFIVKEPEHYTNIIIPEIEGTFVKSEGRTSDARLSGTAAGVNGGKMELLEDIKVGSVLTQDLMTKNNSLLLEENTKITDALIQLLKDSQAVTGITKLIVKQP